jgi:hypothetical protein
MPTTSASRLSAVRLRLKRRGHLVDGAGARRGRVDARAGRQQRAEAFDHGLAFRPRRDDQVDAVEPPHLAEHLLRGGDVGRQQAIECAAAEVVRRCEQPGDGQVDAVDAVTHAERIARSQPVARCDLGAEQHGVRLHHQLAEIGGCRALRLVAGAEIAAKGRLGKGIDAEQSQRLAVQCIGDDVALHHRRAEPIGALGADARIERLIQPARPAGELVRRLAGDGLRAKLEGALRRAVGKVDGDDHRHADRHADDQEDTL